MGEFTVNGQNYRTSKLDAMRQFHLSRKIAPIIPTLIPVFAKLAKGEAEQNDTPLSNDIEKLAPLFEPFAQAIAGMSDEMAEYVMGTCLSVVSRQQGTTWSPAWSVQQQVAMFDDIDAGAMVQICAYVVRESLGPFLAGLLSASGSKPAPVLV